MPELVALVGNGLSVAANEDLRLAALTRSFVDAHAADREDLDRLLGEVDLGQSIPPPISLVFSERGAPLTHDRLTIRSHAIWGKAGLERSACARHGIRQRR